MGRGTKRSVVDFLGAAVLGAVALAAAAQDRPFRTMTGENEQTALCEIPKPPVELTPTNGHQDAYIFWLEKLELSRRLETGQCDCQVDAISWQEVGKYALPWRQDTTVGPATKRRTIQAEIDVLKARVEQECKN